MKRTMVPAAVGGHGWRPSRAASWVMAFRPVHGADEWAATPWDRMRMTSPSRSISNQPASAPAASRSSAADNRSSAPATTASAEPGTCER